MHDMQDKVDHVTKNAEEMGCKKHPTKVVLVLVIWDKVSEYCEEKAAWWNYKFVYIF